MTATPAPALSAEEQAFVSRPAVPESWLPYVAFEGEYRNGQVAHRAVLCDGLFRTGCGQTFRDEEASWETWGVSGPLDPGEWPEIDCPRCPQPPTVVVIW